MRHPSKTEGAEFLWLCVTPVGLFFAERGEIQRLRSAGHASGTPVLRGTAFYRAVGTASFYSGESMLVVQYPWKTMLAHQCEQVASRVQREVVAASQLYSELMLRRACLCGGTSTLSRFRV